MSTSYSCGSCNHNLEKISSGRFGHRFIRFICSECNATAVLESDVLTTYTEDGETIITRINNLEADEETINASVKAKLSA